MAYREAFVSYASSTQRLATKLLAVLLPETERQNLLEVSSVRVHATTGIYLKLFWNIIYLEDKEVAKKNQKSELKKRIREIQASPTFSGAPSNNARSSLGDDDLAKEVKDTQAMLEFLRDYKGQHKLFCEMSRSVREKPGWVPTKHERRLFFGTVRRMASGRGFSSTTDPIVFAASLDVDTRPSSLEQ